MGWKVWGETLLTADINVTPNKRVFQCVKVSRNEILRAMRTWLIVYNNPAFTDLTMQVYSNDVAGGNVPGALLFTSTTTHLKAEIHTLANAVKGVHFSFADKSLKAGDTYHFIPKATGYTGTASAHLAWRKGWPDPVYRTNVDSGYSKLLVAPYMIGFFGADL